MLAVFAEFETNLRRERQLEGDRQGQGRRRVQRPAGFDRCHPGARNEGAGTWASEIAKALKIGRASVYRVLEPADRRSAGRLGGGF
jgi:DNA invertase Pin-like site-specific DNA recombinase